MKRLSTIDILRGIVMCIMALDHVRDFLHTESIVHNPLDLATTSPALFFTRWVTHICAPVFVFLSGASAWLFAQKHGAEATRKYLRTRGIFLILLDLVIVTLILSFDLRYRMILFEVVGAIGFGFLVLSLLLRKSIRTIAWIGAGIMALHGLSAALPMDKAPALKAMLAPFFSIQAISLGPGRIVLTSYPPIPWAGILLLGYAAGPFFTWATEKRIKWFRTIGGTALACFLALRFLNLYGDPSPWSTQKDMLFTVMSFLNVSKYPPSLLFTLLWLGVMFLKLSGIESYRFKWLSLFEVYGRVPLFFFLTHLLLIHLAMVAMVFIQGFRMDQLVFGDLHFGRPIEPSGISLFGVYLAWIAVLILTYPLCKWYGAYKSSHPEKGWLRYL
jgi:uncharacterized membrane protein